MNLMARKKGIDAEQLRDLAVGALRDVKGLDLVVIDARQASSITDFIVVASGTSDRHVRSLAGNVQKVAKEAGARPLGVEGEQAGEWVLVDLGDVIVHVMLQRARAFYQLEKLWGAEVPLAASTRGA